MEAGGKDCEEETLQTAFKKLRVDAESLPGAVSVSEALAPRAASRACLDTSGAKPKLGCPKDNWHGCMRKTSRGASRTQRRRRSKSPILHPPKFTYCSAASAPALSPSGGCLKHQRLAVPEPADPRPAVDGRTTSSSSAVVSSSSSAAAVPAQKELCASGAPVPISPLVFGSRSEHEIRSNVGGRGEARASEEEGGGSEKSACDGAESSAAGAPRIPGPSEAADFRALSELHSSGGGGGSADGARARCSCAWRKSSDSPEQSQQAPECRCGSDGRGDWAGVEVYSFTGLRDVISECERSLPSHEDASRTLGATAASPSSLSSGSSPRSCSEQARAYVDDITIEDLSGYMEYYLYIPKKMSHMAEMMYT